MASKRKRDEGAPEAEDEDEDAPHTTQVVTRPAVVKGEDCPYLDTISRQVGTVRAEIAGRASQRRHACPAATRPAPAPHAQTHQKPRRRQGQSRPQALG